MKIIDPRQEWRTPPEFWAVLNDEFRFDIDVAASVAQGAVCAST